MGLGYLSRVAWAVAGLGASCGIGDTTGQKHLYPEDGVWAPAGAQLVKFHE